MRTAKKFGPIESYHFYPEIRDCPNCNHPLSRSHAVWSKTITSMNETAKVSNWGYRCRQENCSNNKLYRSAQADGIALKGYGFGLDVIVFIGQLRFNQHRNLSEIHQRLKKKGVQISKRRVSDYINAYQFLLKCSQPDKIRAQREQIIAAGGVRLAIDGVQPEQGKEILYIFRDAISGVRFYAVALLHHDHKTLAKEMRHVDNLLAELELPLRSIISDNQSGIVKGVQEVWPNILHQLCQIHYLKAIAKPISQSNSTLAKNLKKKLRPVKDLEREIEQIKAQATQKPESEPKVSINNLAKPLSDAKVSNQITLTANQEQNNPVGERPTLDISRTTPNSSHSHLLSEPVQQQTDSIITDPPSNFRNCCDKLLKPLWDLLTGSAKRPTVEETQDTLACSHNTPSNQISIEAQERADTLLTEQELAYSANVDPTLAISEPNEHKQPIKAAHQMVEYSHIATEPSPTCAKIGSADETDSSMVASATDRCIINESYTNNFIVLDYSQVSTQPKLQRPLVLEAEPTHQQLIILDQQLESTSAKNMEPLLAALGDKEPQKEAILGLPFVLSPPVTFDTPPLVFEKLRSEEPNLSVEAPKTASEEPKTAPKCKKTALETPKTADKILKTVHQAPKIVPEAKKKLSEAAIGSKTAPEAKKTAPEANIELEQAAEAADEGLQLNKRIQVLTGYTDAIRSLLQSKSKAPFILAGLNIYQQLGQIEDSVARCLEVRDDSLLQKLIEMTHHRHDFKSNYELLKRQQELVCGVAEVLDVATNSQGDSTQTGSEVAQSVQDLMDYYGQLAQLYPEDQRIIAHIRARTEEWSKGLFYCYEERGSPRTNNSLEQYNNVLKVQRRRVTGQKNVADYIIRHGPYAIFHDPNDQPDDILARFQNVSIGDLKQEQATFHAANRCPRNIRSFRRDPQSYLNKLETIWLEGTS